MDSNHAILDNKEPLEQDANANDAPNRITNGWWGGKNTPEPIFQIFLPRDHPENFQKMELA